MVLLKHHLSSFLRRDAVLLSDHSLQDEPGRSGEGIREDVGVTPRFV